MRKTLLILAVVGAVAASACSSSNSASSSTSEGIASSTTSSTTEPSDPQTLQDYFGTMKGATAGESTNSPAKNMIYSCSGDPIASSSQAWVADNGATINFSEAPKAPGSVTWDSQISETTSGSDRSISGNGLPDHITGVYPIQPGSAAYVADSNPNSIESQSMSLTIPKDPQPTDSPSCVSGPYVAVMNTGAVLDQALDGNGAVALAEHVVDDCEGHPAPGDGHYHYHSYSFCSEGDNPSQHSPRLGWVLDGYGIYGPRDGGGDFITNESLDECHGHTGGVPNENSDVYHYHINNEFPFSVGCYHGSNPTSVGGGPSKGGGQGPPP